MSNSKNILYFVLLFFLAMSLTISSSSKVNIVRMNMLPIEEFFHFLVSIQHPSLFVSSSVLKKVDEQSNLSEENKLREITKNISNIQMKNKSSKDNEKKGNDEKRNKLSNDTKTTNKKNNTLDKKELKANNKTKRQERDNKGEGFSGSRLRDVLKTPENLKVSFEGNKFILKWDLVKGAEGYKIWYSDSLDGLKEKIDGKADAILGSKKNSWTDNFEGVRYYALASFKEDKKAMSKEIVGVEKIILPKKMGNFSFKLDIQEDFDKLFGKADDWASIYKKVGNEWVANYYAGNEWVLNFGNKLDKNTEYYAVGFNKKKEIINTEIIGGAWDE